MFLGLLGSGCWRLAEGGRVALSWPQATGPAVRAVQSDSGSRDGGHASTGADSAVWGRSGGCWCAGPGSELSAGADGQPAPHAVLLVRR